MLFTQDIDKLLNEITIKDKWQKESNKWNGKLDAETFEYLCSLDPTTNPNKVGRYANWILAKYNPNADFDRLKVCLEWYVDGVKRGIINRLGISNDINAYKSYDEFISAMNGVMHSDDSSMSNSEYNNRQKLEGQFEILGSNSTFDIVACKTFAAERYFGSGTEWCTVANESYFNSYMKKGPLYIIYPKNGNEELKMQFHFKSDSYADKDDEVYEEPAECIENTIEDENIQTALFQLCKKVFSKHKTKFVSFREKLQVIQQRLANGEDPEDVFNDVWGFHEGFAAVRLGGKYNFINQEGKPISNQWYDNVWNFHKGFGKVILNRKYNFINQEGKPISDQWYDWVWDFHEGFARVELNRKWSFINQEGEIAFDQWYDEVGDFHEGFAKVRVDKKYNFINQKGHPINDQWYDGVGVFNEGFAAVRVGKKWNFINQKGHPINDQWYDEVGNFYEGFAMVELNRKWNFINTKGQYLSDQWYDNVWDFHEGFANVVLQGKHNYINTEGEIAFDQWYDWVGNFYEGFAMVMLNGKKYKLDTSGRLHNVNENKVSKTNKNRQKIRLTESSLKQMIKESIKQIFNERLMFI